MKQKVFLAQKGVSQLVIVVVMLVLAISLPIATKLVQQKQENRSQAASEKLGYGNTCSKDSQCDSGDCTTGSNWLTHVCSASGSSNPACTYFGGKCETSAYIKGKNNQGSTCTTSGKNGVVFLSLCNSPSNSRCCVPKCVAGCSNGIKTICSDVLTAPKVVLQKAVTETCPSGMCNSAGTDCAAAAVTITPPPPVCTPSCSTDGKTLNECNSDGTSKVTDCSANTDGKKVCDTVGTIPQCTVCKHGTVYGCSDSGLGYWTCNDSGSGASSNSTDCPTGQICTGIGANAACGASVTSCPDGKKLGDVDGCLDDLVFGDKGRINTCSSVTLSSGSTLAWVSKKCTSGNKTCSGTGIDAVCDGAVVPTGVATTYPGIINLNFTYALDGVMVGNTGCVTSSWKVNVYVGRGTESAEEKSQTVSVSMVGTGETTNNGGVVYKADNISLNMGTISSTDGRFFVHINGPKGGGLYVKYGIDGQSSYWKNGDDSTFVLGNLSGDQYNLHGYDSDKDQVLNFANYPVWAADANGDKTNSGDDWTFLKDKIGYKNSVADLDGNCWVNSGDIAVYRRAYSNNLGQTN